MGASAGSASLADGVESSFFTSNGGATSVYVRVDSGSAVGALINVPGLHASGEFFPMAVGDEHIFRLFDLGIKSIVGKGNGGIATITFGAVAKTIKN